MQQQRKKLIKPGFPGVLTYTLLIKEKKSKRTKSGLDTRTWYKKRDPPERRRRECFTYRPLKPYLKKKAPATLEKTAEIRIFPWGEWVGGNPLFIIRRGTSYIKKNSSFMGGRAGTVQAKVPDHGKVLEGIRQKDQASVP